ncbi:hypothetical protein CFP56_039103 [Quercus suber]|uniref:DC1 domain-containing protein n=1 Tax=Quercus suber TaxID=58331 RepID=A0AAW0LL81_QUESU
MEQQQLLHFCDSKHPLVYHPDYRGGGYTYRYYYCDFNLHMKCAILQLEAEFHDHPLTPFWRWITFTCDICGKEGKGAPNVDRCYGLYYCSKCDFVTHLNCAIDQRNKENINLLKLKDEENKMQSLINLLSQQQLTKDDNWALERDKEMEEKNLKE